MLWSFGATLKIMTDYPKLVFIYWDEFPETVLLNQDGIPISLTGEALDFNKETVGSNPT